MWSEREGKTDKESLVLIKKVRFLIKGGCNSFRKVGIVGRATMGHVIFSRPRSACNRKIEASGISGVWRTIPWGIRLPRIDGQLRKSCWIAFNSGIFYSLWRLSLCGLTTAWAEFIHALVKLLTACGLTIDLLDLLPPIFPAGHRREKKPSLC